MRSPCDWRRTRERTGLRGRTIDFHTARPTSARPRNWPERTTPSELFSCSTRATFWPACRQQRHQQHRRDHHHDLRVRYPELGGAAALLAALVADAPQQALQAQQDEPLIATQAAISAKKTLMASMAVLLSS
jgi:hypothetical protein